MKCIRKAACFWAILILTVAQSRVAATSLDINLTSDGNSTVTVIPCGGAVDYEITGVLSDTSNEGLAGFLLELTLTGGALAPADAPTSGPIVNFDRPAGITGPAGFGGAAVNGRLVQVGGAQNTLKNFAENAPFPIGSVVTGVAHTEVVLVTGSFTAPVQPGTYTLSVSKLAATVIKQGQDGSGALWETEPAGVGTITNLPVIVPPASPPASAANSGPACIGQSVTLRGGPDGMAGYWWTGPGGFTSTQQNPMVSPAVRGAYTLTVIDANNCLDTARTTVELMPGPCDPFVDANSNGIPDECEQPPGGGGGGGGGGGVDQDGDGVQDSLDRCAQTPVGADVDSNGCAASERDSDGDGVNDSDDHCAGTPVTEPADANGCSCSQLDTDGDGANNCVDACPSDPNKVAPGACDCGVPDTDTDSDGVPDCVDNCPGDPNPGQEDSDGNGVGDACTPTPQPQPFCNVGGDARCDDQNPCTVDTCVDNDGDGLGDACEHPDKCAADQTCNPDTGECEEPPEPQPLPCNTHADCPAGQLCNADTNRCEDRPPRPRNTTGCGIFNGFALIAFPLTLFLWTGFRFHSRRRSR